MKDTTRPPEGVNDHTHTEPGMITRALAGGAREASYVTARRRAEVFARDGYRCLACNATDDLTVDHIQHQSRGGGHQEDSLRTLCRSCNSRRGTGQLPGLDDVEVTR